VKAKTPPTLDNTDAIPSTIEKIIVPIESIDLYKTATNWSYYADKIVGVVDTNYLEEKLDNTIAYVDDAVANAGGTLYRHKVSFNCQPVDDSSMTVDVEIISRSNVRITKDNAPSYNEAFRYVLTQPIISDFANVGYKGSYCIVDIQVGSDITPLMLIMVSASTGDVSVLPCVFVQDTIVEF
jgi:hypothetical protein